jgi:hypothetical protein
MSKGYSICRVIAQPGWSGPALINRTGRANHAGDMKWRQPMRPAGRGFPGGFGSQRWTSGGLSTPVCANGQPPQQVQIQFTGRPPTAFPLGNLRSEFFVDPISLRGQIGLIVGIGQGRHRAPHFT